MNEWTNERKKVRGRKESLYSPKGEYSTWTWSIFASNIVDKSQEIATNPMPQYLCASFRFSFTFTNNQLEFHLQQKCQHIVKWGKQNTHTSIMLKWFRHHNQGKNRSVVYILETYKNIIRLQYFMILLRQTFPYSCLFTVSLSAKQREQAIFEIYSTFFPGRFVLCVLWSLVALLHFAASTLKWFTLFAPHILSEPSLAHKSCLWKLQVKCVTTFSKMHIKTEMCS